LCFKGAKLKLIVEISFYDKLFGQNLFIPKKLLQTDSLGNGGKFKICWYN